MLMEFGISKVPPKKGTSGSHQELTELKSPALDQHVATIQLFSVYLAEGDWGLNISTILPDSAAVLMSGTLFIYLNTNNGQNI